MRKIAISAETTPEQKQDDSISPAGLVQSLLSSVKGSLETTDGLRRYLSQEVIQNLATAEDHDFSGELGKAADAAGALFNALNDLIFSIESAYGIKKD